MKKKNSKIKNKWFLVASVCFYISFILSFICEYNRSTTITNLCLGSCFLCLSMVDTNKDKK